jgi:DNA-binding NarL/FixJ family response regulator
LEAAETGELLHLLTCLKGQPMVHSGGLDAWISGEERAVLAASATGRTVKEVAEYLELSPQTVRRLIASAIAKLGARSKLEVIVIAIRQGLIDLTGP